MAFNPAFYIKRLEYFLAPMEEKQNYISNPDSAASLHSGSYTNRTETLVLDQVKVLELISQRAGLDEILSELIKLAEKQIGQHCMASILLATPDEKLLVRGANPGLPESYNRLFNNIPIDYGHGSCGTAAFTKAIVITENISTDILWKDYREIAQANGLSACWSTPLLSKEGKILGTFSIYFNRPKTPQDSELKLLELISRIIILAIEFTLSEEQRKELLINEKNINRKIREERQDFYKILMEAPAMIALLKGPNHVYELVNRQYMQAIGINRNIIGKPIREALPELAGQGIYELLDEVYNTGEPYMGNEVLIKIKKDENGQPEDLFFNFVYQPVPDEYGNTEAILVHATDVSNQVISRKKLEESENRFRSFVLNSPNPIGIYIGREMRIQTVNQAILDAWDKDYSVVGKTFHEVLPELEGQPFFKLLDDVFTTGIPYHAKEDKVLLMRNGKLTTTYYNFSYTALKDHNGHIYGVMNTATEVTDLVQARQQLAETEEALRGAIQLAELGTWSLNIGEDSFTFDNRVAELTGLKNHKSGLQKLLAVVHPEDRLKLAEALKKGGGQEGVFATEFRIVNAQTNAIKIVHARGQIVNSEEGKPQYLSGTVRDITLQKMTEQQLEQQVELRTSELKNLNVHLQKVNDNLQQFAYVASHDLQEPLRKINIFSDILQSNYSNLLDATGKNYLDKIHAAAIRMSNLIRGLLEFSKIESDEKLFSPVNLDMVLENIINDYELLIHEKKAKIQISRLGTIHAIPLQMNQLFYNLVGNALKFSKNDGSARIEITKKILTPAEVNAFRNLSSGKEYCEIIINDNGIGFEQQFAEQIFVIFQRLHTTEHFEGTGIGLAICKKIVNNHQGEIFATAKEGEGASFHIILPVRKL